MNDSKMYKNCEQLVKKYGQEIQLDILVEELSELIQAIMKLKRTKYNDSDWIENAISELVDVEISLNTLYIALRKELGQKIFYVLFENHYKEKENRVINLINKKRDDKNYRL